MNYHRSARLFALLLLVSPFVQSQPNQVLTLDPGVTPHKEIDAVYRTFSRAYDILDPSLVSDLYGSEALYLAPGRPIQKGREEIHKSFKGFFDWAREKGRTLSVSFRIVERGVSGNLAYDVGIYTLKGSGGGMPDGEDQGKFVVIVRKREDGTWYFQVDGYSFLKSNQ